MREIRCFDDTWRFSQSDDDDACLFDYDHLSWEEVSLPHDWSVNGYYDRGAVTGGGGSYAAAGIGWYRKTVYVPASWLDKWVYLSFDGIYMNSKVWVNGQLVGERPYGYISFGYDIGGYLKEGVNVISVRADCSKGPSSRWYTGCGIYRHTWLTVSNKTHILPWGVCVKTRLLSGGGAEIEYELAFENSGPLFAVSTRITDENGQDCASAETAVSSTPINSITQKLIVRNPKLWSPESPVLYSITASLCRGETVLDSYTVPFGIRECRFIPEKGFFLNDKPYKFKGVCLHHDGGVCGAAVPESILIKRLKMLKEMGCNAIRTSHNPFAPEFYDFCDRMGFFVMDEIFDTWDVHKVPFDYAAYFEKWWRKDTEDFILRDRNHPSVVMWSMGNEISAPGTGQVEKFLELFHSMDPTRPVTCGINAARRDCDEKRAVLDIAGYNDGGGACFLYQRDHQRRPRQLMVATESPHTRQTRGVYRTVTRWDYKSNPRLEIPNLTEKELFLPVKEGYFSSYDNSCNRICARDGWVLTERTPYVCGEFRWTGIDYYGEAQWPRRLFDGGVIDTANFPKDHYYLYQSMWRDAADFPMVHVLPHWTHHSFKHGMVIPVWVYTNCEEAELLLNGRSFGRKNKGMKKNLSWDVPWEPGVLTAVAYMAGEEAAKKVIRTAGEPRRLNLAADYSRGVSERDNTVQVNAEIRDAAGTGVPYSDAAIQFDVRGALLMGTENGDSLDHTPLKSRIRRAFGGLCAAVLTGFPDNEPVTVKAAALLGDKNFIGSVSVSAAVSCLTLNGGEKTNLITNVESGEGICKIYYTLDGSPPDRRSVPYMGPFVLENTTLVKAAVYAGTERIFLLEELFIKRTGESLTITERSYTNIPVLTEKPQGRPRSDKLKGIWEEKEWQGYAFEGDGTFLRIINSGIKQLLGYWWYDFPEGHNEDPDNTGEGEIWFLSGEKQKITFVTREAQEFRMDNTQGGMGTIWDHQDEMLFSLA